MWRTCHYTKSKNACVTKIQHPSCPISVPVQTFTELLCWSIAWLSVHDSQCHLMKHFMVNVFSVFIKMFENNVTCFSERNERIYMPFLRENGIANVSIYLIFFHPCQYGICFENTPVLEYTATTQKCVWYANLCNLVRLLWVTKIDHCIWFVFIFWTIFLNYNKHTELSAIFVSIFGMVIMPLAYNKILLWSWLNHLS